MSYAIVKADGTHEVFEGPLSVETIQKSVAGPNEEKAFFELIRKRDVSIYLNEEAKFANLPQNSIITRFAHEHGMISPHDYVAGDCVVVGPPDDEGFDTDLPEGVLEAILRNA